MHFLQWSLGKSKDGRPKKGENLFSSPMSFASHFIFVPFFSAGSSAAGQRGSKDINWPICMFQWASERKWHLQSFLFLGRERIIALHCFKAYQVTSKAFQHPFLAAGWWRRCSSALSRFTDVIFQIYEAFILTSRTAIDFRPLFSLLLLADRK